MRLLTGTVDKKSGCGHFSERIQDFVDDFLQATREVRVGGTLNLKMDGEVCEIICSKWITRNGAHLRDGDSVEVEFSGEEPGSYEYLSRSF